MGLEKKNAELHGGIIRARDTQTRRRICVRECTCVRMRARACMPPFTHTDISQEQARNRALKVSAIWLQLETSLVNDLLVRKGAAAQASRQNVSMRLRVRSRQPACLHPTCTMFSGAEKTRPYVVSVRPESGPK